MAGKTEILGIGDLRTKFAELHEIDPAARRATVAGGQVLKRKAKAIAQANGSRHTGALIKNIVIKREKTPAGVVQYHLGVRHGRALTRKQKSSNYLAVNNKGRIVKRYEDDPYYWRFVEFGTTKHWIYAREKPQRKTRRGLKDVAISTMNRMAKRGSLVIGETYVGSQVIHPGADAKPFLRPALEQGKEEAIAAMNRTLAREIDRQARKRGA